MRSSATKSRHVRGYRIHVFRGVGYEPPSYTTPTMWRESPPIEEWHRVITDPSTRQAWIMQSGRKMRQFQFQRDGSSPTFAD